MRPVPRRGVLAGVGAVCVARPAATVTWQVERFDGRTDPFVTALQERMWARHGLRVRCVDGPADVMPSETGVVWRVVRLGLAGAGPDSLDGLLRYAQAGGAVVLPRAGTAAAEALLHQSLWEFGGDVAAAAAWHRAIRRRAVAASGARGVVVTDTSVCGVTLRGFRGGSVVMRHAAAISHDGAGARALLRWLPRAGRGDGPGLGPAPQIAALRDVIASTAASQG